MKKILVTGSSGYIGRHLCDWLALKGFEVTGLDRYYRPQNVIDYLDQNILDAPGLEGKYDAVVHLAALVQVGGGQISMMDYYRTNIMGTMNLLERIQYDHFIFASTCQANENHVYGKTKLIGEHIVRDYCKLNGKSHTIFRFGNVVGKHIYEPTNTDGLLYNLIKAKETGTFYLYGDDYETPDGSGLRDYIHVLEVCQSIAKSIMLPSCMPGAEVTPLIEYLGHGKLYSVKECIKAFKDANHCDFDVVIKPRRKGDIAQAHSYEVSPYMSLNVFTLEQLMKV